MSEETNPNRYDFSTTTVKPIELPIEGELPSLVGATTWLNSQPLTVDDLRGKVVLVNLWTYTCINWTATARRVASSNSARRRNP